MINSKTNKISRKVENDDLTSQKLFDLYVHYYPNLINSIKNLNAFNRNISHPLLISPFKEYYDSTIRLMFVGKETHYWILNKEIPFLNEKSNKNDIEKLLLNYEIELSKTNQRSPFWQFCHILNNEFNSSNKSFIWNNCIKVDENGKTPEWEVTKASSINYDKELKTFVPANLDITNASINYPILLKEIEILEPNVIVFFTGSLFDELLVYLFPGRILTRINDMVSRVEHSKLPFHSYKTSHPKRLRILGAFDETLEIIKLEIAKGLKSVE